MSAAGAGRGPEGQGGLDPGRIAALFTRSDGSYLCARWGRPLAPVVFGAADASLPVIKGAIEAVAALAHHPVAGTDPELGTNFMLFFLRDWAELRGIPALDRLIEGLGPLVDRLEAAGANQYRVFRFDDAAGGIRACFSFVRMDAEMAQVPAGTLALAAAVQAILLWSDTAFTGWPAFVRGESGVVLLRPEVAGVIRAAYDPALPGVARDPSHALRLAARIGAVT